MDCFYCDLISLHDAQYEKREAAYDLGSPAPRCARHWRYVCTVCRRPAHFMSTAYCPDQAAYYCNVCAPERDFINGPFLSWDYYFRYRSPWTRAWQPSLDRLEFEQRHPHQTGERPVGTDPAIFQASYQPRYPDVGPQTAVTGQLDDTRVQKLWNDNAVQWDADFGIDGDDHRKYHTDDYMLYPLPRIVCADVLDVGCGNGYLCRKLARLGAQVVGVDLSERMVELARRHEDRDRLGITYLTASAAELSILDDEEFDGIFQNHVLSSVPDLAGAVRECYRLLRPGGWLRVVISHPCFSSGPRRWIMPAPDSPRLEEATGFAIDAYFRDEKYLLDDWEGFAPIPYIHRTLSDYWHAFTEAGLTVEDFIEPKVSSRGLAELAQWRLKQCERIPFSCVFHLSKPKR